MRTEAYLKRTSDGLIQVSLKPIPGAQKHYAEWKTPTVRLWWEIHKNETLVDQEKLAWVILMENTSIVPMEGSREQQVERILRIRPGALPHLLVTELLKTTHLSHQEILQIERESMLLWGSHGPLHGKKFHPILEKVTNAIVFHEKLGLKSFPDIDDMDTRTYQGVLHALNCYGQMMSMNADARRLRAQAVRQSGIQQYVGPQNPYHGQ